MEKQNKTVIVFSKKTGFSKPGKRNAE